MIAFVKGTLHSASPVSCIIEAGGLGYRIDIPVTTAERLPNPGDKVFLYIHPVYREESQALYGFSNAHERDFFKLIIEKVSGIGPKIGIALMSQLSLPILMSAIANGDATLIAKCPGIGKKTAERLCIDLRDTVQKLNPSTSSFAPDSSNSSSTGSHSDEGPASAFADAVQALTSLGFKLDSADKAVRKAVKDLPANSDAEVIIKQALKG